MEHRSIVLLFDPKESQIVNATKAFEYIKAKYDIDQAKEERLLKKLKYLAQHFYSAWQKAHREQERFEKYNKDWLDGHLELAEYIAETPSTSTGRGRPQKQFDELSDRSKRRKTDEMFGGNVDTIEKALLATRKIAYSHGDSNMVNLIGHVLKNRESASKMFTTIKDSHGMMSPEEAFEYFLDCDFTKYAYEQTVKKNPSRFPSYHVI